MGIGVVVGIGAAVGGCAAVTTRSATCLSMRISWFPREGLNMNSAVFLVPESSSTVMLLYNCLSSHMDKV